MILASSPRDKKFLSLVMGGYGSSILTQRKQLYFDNTECEELSRLELCLTWDRTQHIPSSLDQTSTFKGFNIDYGLGTEITKAPGYLLTDSLPQTLASKRLVSKSLLRTPTLPVYIFGKTS